MLKEMKSSVTSRDQSFILAACVQSFFSMRHRCCTAADWCYCLMLPVPWWWWLSVLLGLSLSPTGAYELQCWILYYDVASWAEYAFDSPNAGCWYADCRIFCAVPFLEQGIIAFVVATMPMTFWYESATVERYMLRDFIVWSCVLGPWLRLQIMHNFPLSLFAKYYQVIVSVYICK